MSFYNYLMNNEVEDLEEKLKLKEHKGFDFCYFLIVKDGAMPLNTLSF